jgi:hypothetical protein
MEKLFSGIGILFMLFLAVIGPVGWIYWLWLSIQIGGFLMFAFALFPLTGPFAAILGAWSLLFGFPDWAYGFFVG